MRWFAFTTALALILCGSCAQQPEFIPSPNPDIPAHALCAREGVGRLFFMATDDSVIYVYDVDSARLVFAAPIRKEQRFVLDPQLHRATVEVAVVYNKPLDRKHTHRIYLDPHGKMPKPPAEAPNAPINVAPTTAPTAAPTAAPSSTP